MSKEKIRTTAIKSRRLINNSSTIYFLSGTSSALISEGVISATTLTFGGLSVASATKDIWQYRKDKEKKRLEYLETFEKYRDTTDKTQRPYTEYAVGPTEYGRGFEYIKKSDKKEALALLQDTKNRLATQKDNSGYSDPDSNPKVIHTNPIDGVEFQPIDDPRIIFRFSEDNNDESITLSYYEDQIDDSGKKWEIRKAIELKKDKYYGKTRVFINAYENKTCWQDLENSTRRYAISIDEVTELRQSILDKLPQVA